MYSAAVGITLGIGLAMILAAGIVLLVIMRARGQEGSRVVDCPGCGLPHDVNLCRENGCTTDCDCCRDIITEEATR